MNSMLWLRSLQEVFAPLRIFYVKDSQFIRSRGINTSSREPAARQGSGFRGESSEPYYLIRVTRPRRVSYPPLRRGLSKSSTPTRRICVSAWRSPKGGRRLPEATFCMGHGPMPRVASAFAMSACQGSLRLLCCGNLAESWPRAVRGRAGCRDAGMPGCPAAVSLFRSTFCGSTCLGAQHPLFQHPQDLVVLSAVELAGKELVRVLKALPVGQREHLGV